MSCRCTPAWKSSQRWCSDGPAHAPYCPESASSSPARPIERYVRASVDIALGSVEVGVQWLNPAMREIDRNTARAIIESVEDALGCDATADTLTDEIERRFAVNWPDRGWFIEVWNKHEALTQVYAPCGMPRSP